MQNPYVCFICGREENPKDAEVIELRRSVIGLCGGCESRRQTLGSFASALGGPRPEVVVGPLSFGKWVERNLHLELGTRAHVSGQSVARLVTIEDISDILATHALDADINGYRYYLKENEEHPAFRETHIKFKSVLNDLWKRDIENFDFFPSIRLGHHQSTLREFLHAQNISNPDFYMYDRIRRLTALAGNPNVSSDEAALSQQTAWKSFIKDYSETLSGEVILATFHAARAEFVSNARRELDGLGFEKPYDNDIPMIM